MPAGRRALLLPVALLLACSGGPTAPIGTPAPLAATVADGHVSLENRTPDARWFLLVERETSYLVDLNLDPANQAAWIRLPSGASARIPLTHVLGYVPGATALVIHSWTRSVRVEGPDGPQWVGEGFLTLEVTL